MSVLFFESLSKFASTERSFRAGPGSLRCSILLEDALIWRDDSWKLLSGEICGPPLHMDLQTQGEICGPQKFAEGVLLLRIENQGFE